jgi:hypothetical protein
LTIEETRDPSAFTGPVFAHDKVGTNKDPRSKIEDFIKIVEAGVGESADVALFKFCYVDLIEGDDDEALLADYRAAMERLRQSYPETTFVHVTMPLRIVQTGPKVYIKKLIGRPLGGYADNIVRNRFNEGLRKVYSGKEPVFDLAGLESIRPDGSKCTFTEGGETYQALCREYTDDGGHLNQLGRRRAAAGLIALLSAGSP